MAIAIIIVICILMMGLFFGVTIAGGRAHDRQNAERAEAERRKRDHDTAGRGPTI